MPLAPTRTLRIPSRYAMRFDGVDDRVEIPHSPSYATTRHTVMITFMPTSNYYLLFSKGWWGYYRLLMYLVQYLYMGVTRMDMTNFFFPSVMRPRPYVWTTIAYWLDEFDANVKGAFKDGAFYTPSYTINLDYPLCFECSNPLRIMGVPSSAFYPGYVAQVLIYNRALSADEISWNYQNYYNPVRGGLVLCLIADPRYIRDIDNDGILEWIDLSGYNNHGKIYGATLVDLYKSPVRTLPAARTMPVAR